MKCHWYLIEHLLHSNGIDTKNIQIVLDNFENMINYIKEKLCINDYKQYFFGILYTSRNYMSKDKLDILTKLPCLNDLHTQLYNVLLPILKYKNENIYNIIKKDKHENKNLDGSFLSHVLCDLERNVIVKVMTFFNNNAIKVGALIHDGLLLEKSQLITDEIIMQCETFIKKEYPRFNIKLVIKPLETTIEELNDYESDEEITPYEILYNKILNDATDRKLRKDENHIYIKHPKYPLTL